MSYGYLVDGRGERSGSLELIVLDRLLQAEMAAEVINVAEAGKVYLTRGTDYHVGYAPWQNDPAGTRGSVECPVECAPGLPAGGCAGAVARPLLRLRRWRTVACPDNARPPGLRHPVWRAPTIGADRLRASGVRCDFEGGLLMEGDNLPVPDAEAERSIGFRSTTLPLAFSAG